jgi:hypothetical protein
MYPTTSCDQEIDQYIIDEINSLYREDSFPDLAIESISANKTGPYLNFEIGIVNLGLQDSNDFTLIVKADDKDVKEFPLAELEIGTRNILTVNNVAIPRGSSKIKFVIVSSDFELSKENNIAETRLA